MIGKLIVIEGVDSSGKATQTEKIYKRLDVERYSVKKVEFPNYNNESSALVKMYLNGDFGNTPEAVSPYIASVFYTVDRYVSFKKEWEDFYKEGGIVIADRYTTSNIIHQASKIQNQSCKDEFSNWLWDFEFDKFRLPIPDAVIFLDMPPEYGKKLMENRHNKYTGMNEKDIHEKSYSYIVDCYNNSCKIAEKYNWIKISCVENNEIKSVEKIHEEIYSVLKKRNII